MLNDAMTALEHVSSAGGDAVRDFSMERVLKAELARRDQVETQLLQRLRECDSRSIADKEQQVPSPVLPSASSSVGLWRDSSGQSAPPTTDLRVLASSRTC